MKKILLLCALSLSLVHCTQAAESNTKNEFNVQSVTKSNAIKKINTKKALFMSFFALNSIGCLRNIRHVCSNGCIAYNLTALFVSGFLTYVLGNELYNQPYAE